jgi:hypothetical protein
VEVAGRSIIPERTPASLLFAVARDRSTKPAAREESRDATTGYAASAEDEPPNGTTSALA